MRYQHTLNPAFEILAIQRTKSPQHYSSATLNFMFRWLLRLITVAMRSIMSFITLRTSEADVLAGSSSSLSENRGSSISHQWEKQSEEKTSAMIAHLSEVTQTVQNQKFEWKTAASARHDDDASRSEKIHLRNPGTSCWTN